MISDQFDHDAPMFYVQNTRSKLLHVPFHSIYSIETSKLKNETHTKYIAKVYQTYCAHQDTEWYSNAIILSADEANGFRVCTHCLRSVAYWRAEK